MINCQPPWAFSSLTPASCQPSLCSSPTTPQRTSANVDTPALPLTISIHQVLYWRHFPGYKHQLSAEERQSCGVCSSLHQISFRT
ncbi:uncharacterized protein BDV17DRAFT_265108 [Aspergillus undulatus]|uniref:uncharacterized protein n=1 Tax=Aspergillus undulatus TaxID=1810928 RepID=UPI003CCD56C6